MARYACDEKYETGECVPDSRAFRDWLSGVDPASGDDLLQLNGGGPGGAAWNPSASIVVFAEAGTSAVRVGATRLSSVGSIAGYHLFYAPYASWLRSARPLRNQELPDLDGSALRASISVVEVERVEPRGTGAKLFAFSGGE